MAAICGIYKITEKSTGLCYVGQSIDIFRRLKEHHNNISDDWHLKFHEHPELFSLEVLEQCDQSELNSKEKYYITLYNSYYEGFNKTRGNGELIDNYTIKIRGKHWASDEILNICKLPSIRQLAIKIFEASQENTYNNILYLRPWDDFDLPEGLEIIEICTAIQMKYPDYDTHEWDATNYFGRYIIIVKEEEKAWDTMELFKHQYKFDYEKFYLAIPKGKGYVYSRTYYFDKQTYHLLCDVTLNN